MSLWVSSSRLASGLVLAILASCAATPPRAEQARADLAGTRLADADALLKKAAGMSESQEAAIVYQMRAAEIAWEALDTDGGTIKTLASLGENERHALRIIATATEGVTTNFIGSGRRSDQQFSHAGYHYRIHTATAAKSGICPLPLLDSARPAHEVKRVLCKNWHTEDGVGVPYAPQWKRPSNPKMQRFVSSRSYLEPVTAVISFDSPRNAGGVRTASLTGYDPTSVSRVQLGNTDYPLAADFTAPIVEQSVDIKEFKIAITGLIHPGVLDSKLILAEPYNPDRIPVILVHGLNSHPRMWRDVINDLRADPQLRGRYQFMLFYYPTGWPIAYSSLRLREELAALEKLVGKPQKMVLIGHSMGGLLARMQVVTPGRKLWDKRLGTDADTLYQKIPANHLAKRMALFSSDSNIGREIYIATPQRGSGLADLSLTSWFIKILTLPTTITTAMIDLPNHLATQGTLNSVSGLSPANPLYQVLDGLPIQVPHHSIIGDRGHGDTPNSSDGVVPYWSSHLASSQSEKIVPSNHGAYDDPEAILEMRRILMLNAGIKPSAPPPSPSPARSPSRGYGIHRQH
jgi:hypothetical protein